MKDLLTEIIEKRLIEVGSAPAEAIEQEIIEEYLNHLKEKKIHIPLRFKNSIIDDFKIEIRKKVF